jgi:hypothetical protein
MQCDCYYYHRKGGFSVVAQGRQPGRQNSRSVKRGAAVEVLQVSAIPTEMGENKYKKKKACENRYSIMVAQIDLLFYFYPAS